MHVFYNTNCLLVIHSSTSLAKGRRVRPSPYYSDETMPMHTATAKPMTGLAPRIGKGNILTMQPTARPVRINPYATSKEERFVARTITPPKPTPPTEPKKTRLPQPRYEEHRAPTLVSQPDPLTLPPVVIKDEALVPLPPIQSLSMSKHSRHRKLRTIAVGGQRVTAKQLRKLKAQQRRGETVSILPELENVITPHLVKQMTRNNRTLKRQRRIQARQRPQPPRFQRLG